MQFSLTSNGNMKPADGPGKLGLSPNSYAQLVGFVPGGLVVGFFTLTNFFIFKFFFCQMSVNMLVERNNFSQKSEGKMPHEQHKSSTRTKQIPFYVVLPTIRLYW